MSIVVAHDTFIKYLKLQLSGKATVTIGGNVQSDLFVNGITLTFVTDKCVVGSKVWEMLVSIDIYTDDTGNVIPDRKALLIADDIVGVLENGKTDQMYVGGSWVSGSGNLAWPVEDLSFKDVPHDSYVHKNLILPVTYFR
ncbi:hypothetical protein CCP3SC1AL1_320013 [Gammaproteobacteria bacterium]